MNDMIQVIIDVFPDVANEHGLLGCALFVVSLACPLIVFACSVRALWTARFERAQHIPTRRPTSTRAIGIR